MTEHSVPTIWVELWTEKRDMGDKDDNDIEDTSRPETSGVQLACFGLEDLILVLLPAGSGLVPTVNGMVKSLTHRIRYTPNLS